MLIVEPYVTGHRGVWLRWISEQLIKHKWRVVIATAAESLKQPSLAWLVAGPTSIEVVVVEHTGARVPSGSLRSLLTAQLRSYRLLKQLCTETRRKHHVDAVLLPYGDYAMQLTALFGSPFGELPWIPIVMRPSFHYRRMGVSAPQPTLSALRRALFYSFVRTPSLATCLTIDQPLYEFMRTHSRLGHKMGYLPDPVDTIEPAGRTLARDSLDIPNDAVVVLAYGSLTARKGVQYLLPAVCSLGRTDLHVLCVGVPDSEFRTLLSGSEASLLMRAGRLHLIDRWVDQATEGVAFAAADIVWLGYVRHWQSSGVLVQAGRAQLSSIACDAGLIGWTATRYQSGIVVSMGDQNAIVAALDALATSPELRSNLGRNGSQGFASHTTDNAGAIISDFLTDAVARVRPTRCGASAGADEESADVPVRGNQ